ncbi:nucleotide sugar dehydrogenase [Flavobacterium sp. CBA20B-1]|uniref:nucleotide sugar dehydrogenase n=1 Tax=unclassified Flavobacterium TaxID=196869 RepID=UPI0022254CA6|nr:MULTISPECIES: nucleotide sugar dehydrogenase [unclassified Flavobacterium]WCM43156.1 nucleotide sugar dehydrogenase [Flavobacterium sp. CBA20B-1]
MNKQPIIAVIGLGYVGLPLACLFAKKYQVIGYDIDTNRIAALNNGEDRTLEVSKETLQSVLNTSLASTTASNGLRFSDCEVDLEIADYYIITVPTPVDKNNTPDLTPLKKASELVGSVLRKGNVVVYESTVYPGVTEEECVPILERISGLQFNTDFFAGYSPERVNPGDKERSIEKIIKVTSGSTTAIAQEIDALYASVITAGTHKASSIKVAEAAKVIENAQRDINIAFVNELAKIFALMGIDTKEVLQAAGTKWNFMPFQPGLVGGHCIGVDPFYLAQKAQQMGYYSELILSARRLNDSMGAFVASQVVKLMIQNDMKIKKAKVLVLGVTFKENCPDMRNSKVWDVVDALLDYGCCVSVYDPWVNWKNRVLPKEVIVLESLENTTFDAAVLAVAHQQFLSMDVRKHLNPSGVIYDVKGVLQEPVDGRL